MSRWPSQTLTRSPVGLKLSRVIDGKLSEPNLSCTRANDFHGSLESAGEVSQHLQSAIKYLSQSIDPQALLFLEEYDPVHNRNVWAKKPPHYHSGKKEIPSSVHPYPSKFLLGGHCSGSIFTILLGWEVLDDVSGNSDDSLQLLEHVLDRLIERVKLCTGSARESTTLEEGKQLYCFVDDDSMVTVEGNSLAAAAIAKMIKVRAS